MVINHAISKWQNHICLRKSPSAEFWCPFSATQTFLACNLTLNRPPNMLQNERKTRLPRGLPIQLHSTIESDMIQPLAEVTSLETNTEAAPKPWECKDNTPPPMK